jgi:hypothetical protein
VRACVERTRACVNGVNTCVRECFSPPSFVHRPLLTQLQRCFHHQLCSSHCLQNRNVVSTINCAAALSPVENRIPTLLSVHRVATHFHSHSHSFSHLQKVIICRPKLIDHTHAHAHTHARTQTRTHAHARTHVRAHMSTHAHTHAYTCARTYHMHTHANPRARTHARTHAQLGAIILRSIRKCTC